MRRRKKELKITVIDPNAAAESQQLLKQAILEAVAAARIPEPTQNQRP